MSSLWKTWLSRVLMLLVVWGASVPQVHADPLEFYGTYFLVDSTPQRLDLFSNPGVIIEARTYDGTSPLSFIFSTFVDVGPGEPFTDVIRFTYREEGAAPVEYSQTINTAGFVGTFGFPVRFEPIHRTGLPVPTTLTVDLLNSAPDFVIPGGPDQGRAVDSYTYSFQTVSPVPEPSSLLLLVSGAAAVTARIRNRAPVSGRS